MKTDDTTRKGSDSWADGHLYELYIGRWSRPVAAEFLNWLSLPVDCRWLDVGCGTGALSEAILLKTSPKSIAGIDPSEGYISLVSQKLAHERVTFSVGTAESLGFHNGVFDAVVSGLALNFVPDPARAVSEMQRVTKSGGIVAAYVWDYAGKMELIRYFWDTAVSLDRAAFELDEGRRFPLCNPRTLKRLFESAGLVKVEVRAIDVETPFRNFDDYWLPFLGGQGPAPTYAMSAAQELREAIRDHIRAKLPTANDGSIHLTARAWAVRGMR